MRDYGIWVKYRNKKGCAEEGRKDRFKPHPSSQTTQPGERRPPHRRRVKRALDSTRDPKACQPQPQAISQSLLWLLSGSPEPRIPPRSSSLAPVSSNGPTRMFLASSSQWASMNPYLAHSSLSPPVTQAPPRWLPQQGFCDVRPPKFPLNQKTCSPP